MASWIALGVIAVLLFFAGRRAWRDIQAGRCSGCSSGCASGRAGKKSCHIDDIKVPDTKEAD